MNQTLELTIEGMSCGHCVRAVKEALKAVPGVAKVEVQLEPGAAQVQAGSEVTFETLAAAVKEEGYVAHRS